MQDVDNAAEGLKNGIENTAKTAASLAKAGAKAASGNYAGAAVDIVKNSKVLKPVLIFTLVFAFLLLYCTMALPLAIFEHISSYVTELNETWEEYAYAEGDPVTNALNASLKVAEKAVTDSVTRLWNGLKKLFSSSEEGEYNANAYESDDTFTELGIILSEENLDETINKQLDSTVKKIEQREEEIKSSILSNQKQIAKALEKKLGGLTADEKKYYNRLYDEVNYDFVVNKTVVELTPMYATSAVELQSLYTTQMDDSPEDQKLSDCLKWLGWRNTSLRRHTVSFDLADIGVSCSVPLWNGTFMPQYLVEQMKQDIETAKDEGKSNSFIKDIKKKYQNEHGAAAVDFLITVECDSLDDIEIVRTTDTYDYEEEIEVPDTEQASSTVESAQESERGYSTKEEPKTKTETITITGIDITDTVTLRVYITTKPADILAEKVGLWKGDFSDEQK